MSQSLKYKTILLDADGTLFDMERAEQEALRQALASHGIDWESSYWELFDLISYNLWMDYDAQHINADEFEHQRFDQFLQAVDGSLDVEAFHTEYMTMLSHRHDLMDGAEALCEALAEHCQLVIVTNGEGDVQKLRLQQSAIAPYITALITPDDVGCYKPDPMFFDFALRILGLDEEDKDHVLMVGDSLSSDIYGGMQFGIDTCWLNPSGRTDPLTPTYEIQHLSQLVDIILQKSLS